MSENMFEFRRHSTEESCTEWSPWKLRKNFEKRIWNNVECLRTVNKKSTVESWV